MFCQIRKSSLPIERWIICTKGLIQKQIAGLEKLWSTLSVFQLGFIMGINLFEGAIRNRLTAGRAVSYSHGSSKRPYPKHNIRKSSEQDLPPNRISCQEPACISISFYRLNSYLTYACGFLHHLNLSARETGTVRLAPTEDLDVSAFEFSCAVNHCLLHGQWGGVLNTFP